VKLLLDRAACTDRQQRLREEFFLHVANLANYHGPGVGTGRVIERSEALSGRVPTDASVLPARMREAFCHGSRTHAGFEQAALVELHMVGRYLQGGDALSVHVP